MTSVAHALPVVAVLAVVIVIARWDARRRPFAPCLACRKRKRGSNAGSTYKAWGRCRVCGGSGERRRLLAVIFGGGREK